MSSVRIELAEALAARYDIESELGAGAAAIVYLAHDRKQDRKVALKVLRPEVADAIGAERFLNEIRFTARLSHPNIMPLFDSGEAGGHLYFTMPVVEGESLRQKLEREKQLDIREAVGIARAVAAGLACAHEKGVVHRDIKPENILLHRGVAVIADFGIAAAIDRVDAPRLTATGISVGTPRYMSPEMATRDRNVGPASDIYALATVLYEMLAGDAPFTGTNARAVISRIIVEKPTPLRMIRDTVPPALEAAVDRALAKVARDRFESVAAFADALAAALEDTGGSTTAATGERAIGASPPRAQPVWIAAVRASYTRRPWMYRTGAGLLVIVAAIAIAVDGPAGSTGASVTAAPVIGILPVSSLAQNSGVELGLAARLSDGLAGASGIEIRSVGVVAAHRARGLTDDSIAKLLNIDYFVSAMVDRLADSTSVIVQLVDARTSTIVQSNTVRAAGTTPTELVTAVTTAVETVLRRSLGRQLMLREWRAGTDNREAFELRYRAQEHVALATSLFNASGATAERELLAADSLLQESQRLDPRWAEPWLGRAEVAERRALLTLVATGRSDPPRLKRLLEEAEQHANRALRLRPDLPAALTQRGLSRSRMLAYRLLEPAEAAVVIDSAEADLRRALDIDPTNARAAATLGELLFSHRGAFAEAREYGELALRLDHYLEDTSGIINRIALASFELGDDEHAYALCREGIRRFPDDQRHYACALDVMGWGRGTVRVDSVWWLYHALIRLTPQPEMLRTVRPNYGLAAAAALARAGLADSARNVIARITSDNGPPGDRTIAQMLYWEAAVRFRLGDTELARALYDEYRKSYPQDAAAIARRRPLRDYIDADAARAPG